MYVDVKPNLALIGSCFGVLSIALSTVAVVVMLVTLPIALQSLYHTSVLVHRSALDFKVRATLRQSYTA